MSWKEDVLEYLRDKNDVIEYLSMHPQKEYMVHLSPARFNFIAWYPFSLSMNVLEVNGQTGEIAEGYINSINHLDFYETDESLVEIAKVRFEGNQKISFIDHPGQSYDLAIITGDFTLDLLKQILSVAKKVIIAFDNAISLSKLSGNIAYLEENSYELLEKGKGYTKQEIEDFLTINDCKYTFYYPFPDYFFTTEIYSDGHLPKIGDLIGYSYDYQKNDSKTFDEIKVRDQIIKHHKIVDFMNSYIVEVESNVVL